MASSSSASSSSSAAKKPRLEGSSWSIIGSEQDVKHKHVCRIENFSEKMQMAPGTMLESGMFTIKIGDKWTRWCLQIFPNGDPKHDADSKGWLSIYLFRNSDCSSSNDPIQANIKFSAVDIGKNCERTFSFKKENHYLGFPKFISHVALKTALRGYGDTLTITCEITIEGAGGVGVSSSSDNKYVLIPSDNVETSQSKCLEDMENVFLAGMFTDVTFSVQEKEFHCHKAVLAGRSTVFHTMFTVDMREKNEDRVEIKDIDADTFNEMIIFIYSGKAKNLQQKAASLLMAAEKYNLMDLKAKCEVSLSHDLDVDNVLDMLVLADLHRASNLRDLALKFVADNRKIIMNQKEWREKLTKNPEIMADIIAILAKE